MALSALALAALVLRAVAYLASWYPGDETIRASSESFLRLMFSRSGVSFGTASRPDSRAVTIDAGDAIKTTREAAVVQGEIARVPRWRAGEDVNVTRHAELGEGDRRADGCFFRVHADAPAITFFDDGATRVKRLRGLDELQRVAVRRRRWGVAITITITITNRSIAPGRWREGADLDDDFSVADLRCEVRGAPRRRFLEAVPRSPGSAPTSATACTHGDRRGRPAVPVIHSC